MDASVYKYSEALTPKTFVIDEVELRPFSLGHWIKLEDLHSPFLEPDPETTFSQVDGIVHYLNFLLICGQTWEDNCLMLDDPNVFKQCTAEFGIRHMEAMKRDPDWNIFKKVILAKQYLQYFIRSMPLFKERHEASVPSGLDWKGSMSGVLQEQYGYSESKILNMSIRKAFYDWCSFNERHGSLNVMNAMEIEAGIRAKAQLAEFIKTQKALAEQKEEPIVC